ncbi:MFS transporter [Azospirillum sp. sgz301742]
MAGVLMMARDPIRALVFRLTAATVAVLLAAAGMAAWLALDRFNPLFQGELARKADTVGDLLATQVNRGLAAGIPLDRMPGLDALFHDEAGRHREIAYIAITGTGGRVLAADGKPLRGVAQVEPWRLAGPDDSRLVKGFIDNARPLGVGGSEAGTVAGRLHVGIDSAFLAKASTDLMLDMLAVVLVAVLLVFEVLLLVVNVALRRPIALRLLAERAEEGDFRTVPPKDAGSMAVARVLDGVNERHATLTARVAELTRTLGTGHPRVVRAREGLAALASRFRFRTPGGPATPPPFNLVFLRLPVFLFCLSEELSRPFLPAYAQSFGPSAPWLTPELVVSLPITLFMLIWALSQPSGARFSERWGRARVFLAGALIGSISLAMTAFAATLYDLLAWRCLTALGYGLVLITAQGIVVDHTTPRNRASGMAMFIGALLAAGVCGPVSGGIIADQVGFRATFLTGAVLALAAGLMVALLLFRAPTPVTDQPLAPGSARLLFRDARFAALMVLSAVPTKIASTAFLFCLIPLLLTADGASKAEIGRVQMMYFLAFILVSPVAATLSDRWQARRGFITLGGLGTAVSCLPMLAPHTLWAPPLAIALFGMAQALIGAPQLTLVSQIARDGGLPETAAIGWYRLIERLGGAAGPVLAMAMAVASSYRDAMFGIGMLCGVSALVFWFFFRTARTVPALRPQEA